MRRLTFLPLLVLCVLVAPSAAQAADTSWVLPDNTRFDLVNDASFVGNVYTDSSACSGKGRIYFRSTSAAKWTAPKTLTDCTDDNLGQATVTRDSGNGRLFVVWSQVNILKKERSGVVYRMSKNGGRSWTKTRILVRRPKQITASWVSAAARSSHLWVMYTAPSKASDTKPGYRLESFNQTDGLLRTRNLAVGSGKFRVNAANGAMQLYASRLGLFSVWRLTDFAGKQHWFAADSALPGTSSKANMRWVWRGRQDVGKGTMFTVGEDRRPYRLVQGWPDPPQQGFSAAVTISRWSFNSHKYVDNYKNVGFRYGVPFGQPVVGFTVSTDRKAYFLYRDFAGTQSEIVNDAEPGVRTKAPGPACRTNKIIRVSLNGQAEVGHAAWPFAALAVPGSDVLEWMRPGSGLETVTTRFGAPRMIARIGHQDIDPTGDVTTDVQRVGVISDPVTFMPHNPFVNDTQTPLTSTC